ncbi:hypothetical protein Pan44_30890 [Caulifigura coniformis]|uniref:Uncharacterized protein n=1 Tax=Caulifigura coniformis TaxID=2527983 RepID=A0A517SFZ2_9PLAN|nr:hypothetical protein [Caulifigura coniformis]QDT55048.1 hypothetical protein Pan44_30890 [Caulifigura coniformis]
MTSLQNSGARMLLGAALVLGSGPSGLAQSEKKTEVPTSKPAVQAADLEVVNEDAALEFAKRHHPELAKLLGPMKAASPRDYQKAIRELDRVSDRLIRMETRSPDRYAIEIELWKTESRLRLVAAKTAMLDDDERREQIEKLVNERNQLRVRLYEFERDEARQRIVQLDRQIESLKSQESQAVRKEVDRLVNSARSSAKRVKTRLKNKAGEGAAPLEKPKAADPKRAPGSPGASQ